MIRAVFDTNILMSAFLWSGAPATAFDRALSHDFVLATSEELIAELEEVLSRPKFVNRLSVLGKTIAELIAGYRDVAEVAEPTSIARVVLNDLDDDAVIACAVAGQADYIISGDRHLLSLGDIPGHKNPDSRAFS